MTFIYAVMLNLTTDKGWCQFNSCTLSKFEDRNLRNMFMKF